MAKSDRELALDAVEDAFENSIHNLFRILQEGLTGNGANPAQTIARFEAGLNLVKTTRGTAITSIGKILT